MISIKGVTVTVDRMAQIAAAVEKLAGLRVMVGVPQDKSRREDGPVTNAVIGYVHENGAPEMNIPARPHLVPGVRDARDKIEAGLRRAGELALDGKPAAVERQYHLVGTAARDAVKRRIVTGPFVPLAPATIAARRRRSAGSKYRRKAVGPGDVRPLNDTGQYRNSINYVVRKI